METVLLLKTRAAKDQLEEGLRRWPSSLTQALQRARLFQSLKDHLARFEDKSILREKLEDLQTHEEALESLCREPTPTEKEGYSQVCFTETPFTGLNALPYALAFVSLYKTYLVPAFSLIFPLLSWILPYIFLKTFYNINIPFNDYCKILWRMWNGQSLPRSPQDLLNPPPEPTEPPSILSQIKSMTQNAWTLFTVGQTLYEPIKQARHFTRLDADCLRLGQSIRCVKETSQWFLTNFKRWLPSWFSDWIRECPSGARESFAYCLDYPYWLPHTFRTLGRFEVLLRLAQRSDVVSAEFVRGQKPVLLLKGFGDPQISSEKRVLSNLRLGYGCESHAILTGPNRGGKSSFLRGILDNVRFAHAFGAAFAEKAQMTYFSWIADALRLDDAPGEESMFEREVKFASGIVHKKDGCGLVLYDELFHSTNPPDATRASQIFCTDLWKKENCLSIISTHIYSLARAAPAGQVKQLCVAAWRHQNKYVFSYKVQKGVCEVSSVDLLLRGHGLLSQP